MEDQVAFDQIIMDQGAIQQGDVGNPAQGMDPGMAADQGQGQDPAGGQHNAPDQGQEPEPTEHDTLKKVAHTIAGLANTINLQGIRNFVKVYDGNPREYKNWVKSIEKWAMVGNLCDGEYVKAAFQTAQGGVSDFIQRFMADHPEAKWGELKRELTARFGEITDPQHALSILRHIKQKREENVQMYSERLIDMAVDAFAEQFSSHEGRRAVEPQLIGYFQDGLYNDVIKMRVMRMNPRTLQAAVTIAMEEQNLRKRFELRKGDVDDNRPPKTKSNFTSPPFYNATSFNYQPAPVHAPISSPSPANMEREETPMEVDHIRPSKRCERCAKRGHVARECRARWPATGHINAVQEGPNSVRGCWVCGSPQHFKRECPERRGRRQHGNFGNRPNSNNAQPLNFQTPLN